MRNREESTGALRHPRPMICQQRLSIEFGQFWSSPRPLFVCSPPNRGAHVFVVCWSTAVVKATAGVVADNSVGITTRFYPHMFAAHPELMRVFNKGEPGDRRAPRAGSQRRRLRREPHRPECARLRSVMRRIAHKHVAGDQVVRGIDCRPPPHVGNW